jgi:hypothetical protein
MLILPKFSGGNFKFFGIYDLIYNHLKQFESESDREVNF